MKEVAKEVKELAKSSKDSDLAESFYSGWSGKTLFGDGKEARH